MASRVVVSPLLALAIAGCGNGDSGFDARNAEYDGTWDVRYNLTFDECAIVEPGVFGFTDAQDIVMENANVRLFTSVGGFDSAFEGPIREDGSFVVQQSSVGPDSEGFICEIVQTISYEATDSDTASTQLVRRLLCEDGFGCESRAVGEAERRIGQ